MSVFNKYNIKRFKISLICVSLLGWVAVLGLEWFRIGHFPWHSIGITIIILILIYLLRRRTILKIIGEYPHPKRNKRVIIITSWLVVFLLFPFTYFLTDQLGKTELDIKSFAIFIIVPILFGYTVGISRIPNTTQKTQTSTICVIKKLATSTVLFIIFFPLLNLVNKLRVDITAAPDFHLISIGNGVYAWSMIFCFYAGLILFIIAVMDFVLVINDISLRKKPGRT